LPCVEKAIDDNGGFIVRLTASELLKRTPQKLYVNVYLEDETQATGQNAPPLREKGSSKPPEFHYAMV